MQVSVAAFSATRRHDLLARFHQIPNDKTFLGVPHHRAGRNVHNQVLAASSLFVRTASSVSVVCFPGFAVSDGRKMIYAFPSFQNDAASVAPIAPIGATEG